MKFSDQYKRAERLARRGSLVIVPEVDPFQLQMLVADPYLKLVNDCMLDSPSGYYTTQPIGNPRPYDLKEAIRAAINAVSIKGHGELWKDSSCPGAYDDGNLFEGGSSEIFRPKSLEPEYRDVVDITFDWPYPRVKPWGKIELER